MPLSVKEFGATASQLARNPLSIIALFIVLVYGIAGLVLGYSNDHLNDAQKWSFVIFLVSFPIVVFATFVWLVVKHHKKLYAPADYRSDESFFKTLSPEQQKIRLEQEVSSFLASDEAVHQPTDGNREARNNIRHSYLLAEELAIRELESSLNVSVIRNVRTLRGKELDGIYIKNGQWNAVEIKLFSPEKWEWTAKGAYNHMHAILNDPDDIRPSSALLVFVSLERLNPNFLTAMKNKLHAMVYDKGVQVEAMFLSLPELKEKYGLSDET